MDGVYGVDVGSSGGTDSCIIFCWFDLSAQVVVRTGQNSKPNSSSLSIEMILFA